MADVPAPPPAWRRYLLARLKLDLLALLVRRLREERRAG